VTTIDAETLTAQALAPMLRAWAAGLLAGEAAVELLIRHDVWLHRTDFRAALFDAVGTAGDRRHHRTPRRDRLGRRRALPGGRRVLA